MIMRSSCACPSAVSTVHACSIAPSAKGARAPGALHVSYCHTPPRYLWDLAEDYVPGLLQSISRHALHRLQQEDLESAEQVDHFIANSRFVAGRISETYGREADVIHPPVDTDSFESSIRREGSYFLAGGRLVGYKRVDLAIRASNEMFTPRNRFGLNISILQPLPVVISPNTCLAVNPDTTIIIYISGIVRIVCVWVCTIT